MKNSRDAPDWMREYHFLLLEVIDEIERYLPNDPIEIRILLKSYIFPPVGSAIGEIFLFGSEQQ